MASPSAFAPPLTVGQMIKIVHEDYQGETGVILKQNHELQQFLVQVIGENNQEVYLSPKNLKPMYLSDSPRPKIPLSPCNRDVIQNSYAAANHQKRYPDHITTPQDMMMISQSPSNVSSITSPTLSCMGSPMAVPPPPPPPPPPPTAGSIRKYQGGPVEVGHEVRIVGGDHKGQRGLVVELRPAKVLVQLETSGEEVLLMPNNLGPWEERSAAHTVLKQRRNTTSDTNEEDSSQEERNHGDILSPMGRPRCSLPIRSFWNPVNPIKKSMSDATSLTGLQGTKIELEDSDDNSSTENYDPTQATSKPINSNNNPAKEEPKKEEPPGHVLGRNRLGSPIRRRRFTAQAQRMSVLTETANDNNNSQTAGKDTPKSTKASDRSLFRRSSRQSYRTMSASRSTESTACSTTPSTSMVTEEEIPRSPTTTMRAKVLMNIKEKRSVPAPPPVQVQAATISHTRSIYRRRSSVAPKQATVVSPENKGTTNIKVATPKASTPKANRFGSPKAATPKAAASHSAKAVPSKVTSTIVARAHAKKSGTPRAAATPKATSPLPARTPREALRERFTFRNVEARQEAVETSLKPEETKPVLRASSPPPVQMQRSLSPLMLRRRARSNTKASEPTTPKQKEPTSPQPRGRRRDTSRLRGVQSPRDSPRQTNNKDDTKAKYVATPTRSKDKASATAPKQGSLVEEASVASSKEEKRRQSRSILRNGSFNRSRSRETQSSRGSGSRSSRKEASTEEASVASSKEEQRRQGRSIVRNGSRREVVARSPPPRSRETSYSGTGSSSCSLSTTSSTGLILRNYSEGPRTHPRAHPRPTRTINITSSRTGASSATSTEGTESSTSHSGSSTGASSSSSKGRSNSETSTEGSESYESHSGSSTEESSRSAKGNSNSGTKHTTSMAERIMMKSSNSTESTDDTETEKIIAKYNKIVQKRLNKRFPQAAKSPKPAAQQEATAQADRPFDEDVFEGILDDPVVDQKSSLSSFAEASSLSLTRTVTTSRDSVTEEIRSVEKIAMDPQVLHVHSITPQSTMSEPKLFTRKMMEAHLRLPPPPPPPLPPGGLKSPKTPRRMASLSESMFSVSSPHLGVPPLSPGGSRRNSSAETSNRNIAVPPRGFSFSPKATSPGTPMGPRTPKGFSFSPKADTPPGTPMGPRTPRDLFVEPAPTTPRTPRSPNFLPGTFERMSVVDDECDVQSEDSFSLGDEIPQLPSSTLSKEEQQYKDRNNFQKSLLQAASKGCQSHRSCRDPSNSNVRVRVKLSPSPYRQVPANFSDDSGVSTPLKVITQQSFSPTSESQLRDHRRKKSERKHEKVIRQPAEEQPFCHPTTTSASFMEGDHHQKKKYSLGASWQEILQFPSRSLTRKDILSSQNSASASQSRALRSCYLCTKTFKVKDVVRTLPCHHNFHVNCIDQFLFQQAECPVCKHPAIVLEI